MSIDKNVLYRMLYEFINEKYHQPDKYVLLRLVKQVVYHNPEDNCVIKGRRADWNGLPYYKSLFWSSRYCGLPIGNLTSQIFANFYLDRLDKFVAEELEMAYYGRYVDDFVLIDRSKERLLEARDKICAFLQRQLKLNLHPQKFYLQHYKKGVRFIGAVIKPNRVYIGNRTKGNLYRKIYQQLPVLAQSVEHVLEGIVKFASSINSYIGFMRHYDTYRLRSKILKLLDDTFLGEISELRPHAEKFALDKRFRPSGQKKRQLRRQRQYRRFQQNKRQRGG